MSTFVLLSYFFSKYTFLPQNTHFSAWPIHIFTSKYTFFWLTNTFKKIFPKVKWQVCLNDLNVFMALKVVHYINELTHSMTTNTTIFHMILQSSQQQLQQNNVELQQQLQAQKILAQQASQNRAAMQYIPNNGQVQNMKVGFLISDKKIERFYSIY